MTNQHFEHDYADEIAGRYDNDHDPYDDGLGCARGILFGVGLFVAAVVIGCITSPWWL
jgi:hypothetical protein